jgi:hypothetical protein
MANVLSFTYGAFANVGTASDSHVESGAEAFAPRGRHNEHYKAEPDVGGSTRPAAGQAWPRGNVRGNG